MSRRSEPFRIVNGTLILPDRLVPGGAVHVSDGRLVVCGPRLASSGDMASAVGEDDPRGYNPRS